MGVCRQVVLIAGSERDLQENLEVWNLALVEKGMKINKSKTKVIVISDGREEIKI